MMTLIRTFAAERFESSQINKVGGGFASFQIRLVWTGGVMVVGWKYGTKKWIVTVSHILRRLFNFETKSDENYLLRDFQFEIKFRDFYVPTKMENDRFL